MANGISFGTGATSRAKSPTPKPKSKSQGGQFEPIIDSYSGRVMDTDAEYKALSLKPIPQISEYSNVSFKIDKIGESIRKRFALKYLNYQISSSYNIPESLRRLLYKAWQNHYEEFYEEQAEGNITLEETLLEILDALEDKDDSLCHSRYIYMALILALAVKPTIKAYLPNESKTEQIFQLVINWFENRELPTEEKINQLFPQKSVGSQSIDEALDVFKNLLQVLNPANAKVALLEILDNCLEGYAIFPGSQGRRDLFNWWLLDVVPATWCLKFPESFYTIAGIVPFNSEILPNKLLNIFDNYRNQEIIKVNNSYQQLGRSLFAKLDIDLDEVPFEYLSNYTAVKYFLTIEDEPPADATNLEKVNRYIQSFHHLGEADDWEKATEILAINLDNSTNQVLDEQLGTWGYYHQQIELYKKLLHKLSNRWDIICFLGLGNAYQNLGNYIKAIEYHEEELNLAQSIGDRYHQWTALGGLGNVYLSQGNYSQATKYLQEGLQIAKAVGNQSGEGAILGSLGLISRSQGDYPQAIDYHQQQLKIAQQTGNIQGEVSALINLGTVCCSQGNYTQAIDYHQQSLTIAKKIENPQQEATILGNLGLDYYSQKDYEKAIDYHRQSLTLARQIEDRYIESASLGNLGIAYQALKNYSEAINYHQQHLKMARQIGNLLGEGIALGNLGSIYQALKDYSQAIDYHQQSLTLARQIGNRDGERITLRNLGVTYLNLGNARQAINYYNQSLTIARELDAPEAREYDDLQEQLLSQNKNIDQLFDFISKTLLE